MIKANSVTKVVDTSEGSLQILSPISFEVKSGESVAIIGASGSGKSTLLGLLAGLDQVTEGEIFLDCEALHSMNEEERAILRGNKVGFIGKVSDDDLGNKYEEGLKKENVQFFYSKKKEITPTGTCLILITPDSERTMCTFLGTAGKINDEDVNLVEVKKSDITFLEGYLWDDGDPKKAFDKAINNSNKVAMSLSDLFCVERHKPHFLNLVKNKLDIHKNFVKKLTNSLNFCIVHVIRWSCRINIV